MPDVNLLALVGLRAIDLSNLLLGQSRVWAITPAVHLPIFEAARLQGALGLRDAQYDMAVESYNATVIGAVRETADAIASYDHATRELKSFHDAVRRTDQAYELALSRYRIGPTDYIAVLIIENALLARRSVDAGVAEQRVVSAVRIIRSLGGGYTAPKVAATP